MNSTDGRHANREDSIPDRGAIKLASDYNSSEAIGIEEPPLIPRRCDSTAIQSGPLYDSMNFQNRRFYSGKVTTDEAEQQYNGIDVDEPVTSFQTSQYPPQDNSLHNGFGVLFSNRSVNVQDCGFCRDGFPVDTRYCHPKSGELYGFDFSTPKPSSFAYSLEEDNPYYQSHDNVFIQDADLHPLSSYHSSMSSMYKERRKYASTFFPSSQSRPQSQSQQRHVSTECPLYSEAYSSFHSELNVPTRLSSGYSSEYKNDMFSRPMEDPSIPSYCSDHYRHDANLNDSFFSDTSAITSLERLPQFNDSNTYMTAPAVDSLPVLPVTPRIGDHTEDKGEKKRHRKKNKKKEPVSEVKTTCISEEVDLNKLLNGEDERSAVMIRNLPNRFTKESLSRVLDTIVPGHYTILNMPLDPKTRRNLGYSFIQFHSVNDLIKAYKQLQGQRWPNSESLKTVRFCYAKIQVDGDKDNNSESK